MISEHVATLKELETYYSYEDALNILEAVLVARVNEYQSTKKWHQS